MKAEDLKTKTPDELKKLLMDLRKEQLNLRFQRTQGTLENTAEMRKTRRTIARVKTYLNQSGQPEAPKPGKKKAPEKSAASSPAKAKKTTAKKEKKAA